MAAYPNAYEALALDDLPLKEVLPKKVHRRLLSKQLITSTTQFNAVAEGNKTNNNSNGDGMMNSSAVGGSGASSPSEDTVGNGNHNNSSKKGPSSSYVIRKKIKSPQALLQDVDAQTTKGITVADALASLYPPVPWIAARADGDELLDVNGEPVAAVHVDPTIRGELSSESDEEEGGEDNNGSANHSHHHFNNNNNAVDGGGVVDEAMVSVARADHADVLDVVCLQERILQLCAEGKAKMQGVCNLRETVYEKGMQELIRQVTVLCPERGLLLAELTEEIVQSTTTYDLLFDSACQYAVRKAIERDLYRTMLVELDDLRTNSRMIENRVQELRAKREGLEKRFAEQRESDRKHHEDEVAFLKRGNAQLSAEIKRLTT